MEGESGLGGHILLSIGVTFAALLPIADPIGNLPPYLALVRDLEPRERRSQARKACFAMFAILVVALLFGRFLLSFFGISLGALTVIGGLIVGYLGWKMVLGPPPGETDGTYGFSGDIYMTPLAMPMLAGPGAIGVVLGLASRSENWEDYIGVAIGILLISIVSYVVLLSAERIVDRIGEKGNRRDEPSDGGDRAGDRRGARLPRHRRALQHRHYRLRPRSSPAPVSHV